MRATRTGLAAYIESYRDVTPTVREFTLRAPADVAKHLLSWQPGAHLQLYLTINGLPQTRHYSLLPASAPDVFKIAVKRAEPGRGGSQAMWQLQIGDTLHISPPLNHFPLDVTAPAYLLIAGGIGITPMLGMAARLSQAGANFRLLYGARDAQEFAFEPELRELLGERLQLSTQNLDFSKTIEALPELAQAYVCGPSGMLSSVRNAWLENGRPEHLLRFETFGGGPGGAPFEVFLPRHGLTFEVAPSMSLLDTLEQQGIAAMYGCRKGECGLCAVNVLSLDGEIEHRDVFFSEHEKKTNSQICVCVSRVRGKIALDSAYRPEATL